MKDKQDELERKIDQHWKNIITTSEAPGVILMEIPKELNGRNGVVYMMFGKYFLMFAITLWYAGQVLSPESRELGFLLKNILHLLFYGSLGTFPLITIIYFLNRDATKSALVLLGVDVIFILFIFTYLYMSVGLIGPPPAKAEELVKDFKSCLYFSISTWTTLGYGDFRPSESVRLLAVFEAVFGYLYMAIFVALLLKSLPLSYKTPVKFKNIDMH